MKLKNFLKLITNHQISCICIYDSNKQETIAKLSSDDKEIVDINHRLEWNPEVGNTYGNIKILLEKLKNAKTSVEWEIAFHKKVERFSMGSDGRFWFITVK